jgi:hypothetical protein
MDNSYDVRLTILLIEKQNAGDRGCKSPRAHQHLKRMIDVQQPQQERQLYVLKQNKNRALIPKALSLIILGGIFYLGVLLNVSLLELTASQESIVTLLSLVLLFSIITVGIYFTFHRATQKFIFYGNRIVFNKKEVYYNRIINLAQKQDFWDKMFKTYSINLGNDFYLRNIPQTIQINNYLQQLVNYSRSQAATISSRSNFQQVRR